MNISWLNHSQSVHRFAGSFRICRPQRPGTSWEVSYLHSVRCGAEHLQPRKKGQCGSIHLLVRAEWLQLRLHLWKCQSGFGQDIQSVSRENGRAHSFGVLHAKAQLKPRPLAQLSEFELLCRWHAVRWMAFRWWELVWRKMPGAVVKNGDKLMALAAKKKPGHPADGT